MEFDAKQQYLVSEASAPAVELQLLQNAEGSRSTIGHIFQVKTAIIGTNQKQNGIGCGKISFLKNGRKRILSTRRLVSITELTSILPMG